MHTHHSSILAPACSDFLCGRLASTGPRKPPSNPPQSSRMVKVSPEHLFIHPQSMSLLVALVLRSQLGSPETESGCELLSAPLCACLPFYSLSRIQSFLPRETTIQVVTTCHSSHLVVPGVDHGLGIRPLHQPQTLETHTRSLVSCCTQHTAIRCCCTLHLLSAKMRHLCQVNVADANLVGHAPVDELARGRHKAMLWTEVPVLLSTCRAWKMHPRTIAPAWWERVTKRGDDAAVQYVADRVASILAGPVKSEAGLDPLVQWKDTSVA